MPIVDFQSIFSNVIRVFKSHKILKAESNSRLIPIKEQLEDIFKRHELNNIEVILAYIKPLWDSKFALKGSYLKSQEATYNKALEEANKLLKKNHIQLNLIGVPCRKYGSEVVELLPEYIWSPYSMTQEDVFIPRDGNWQDEN